MKCSCKECNACRIDRSVFRNGSAESIFFTCTRGKNSSEFSRVSGERFTRRMKRRETQSYNKGLQIFNSTGKK